MANSNQHRPDHGPGQDFDLTTHDDGTMATAERLAIKSMLEAVHVPENLNERIKARLRMASLVDPCLKASADAAPSTESTDAPVTVSTGNRFGERTRRVIVLLAMAAMLAGLAFLANQWRQPNEREWLVRQCQQILNQWEQDNPANLQIDSNLTHIPSAVHEQLARVTLRGTRSLAELGSKFKGTLYRLEAADGHSLVLMKLSDLPTVRGLNSRFSVLPTPSGGWKLVALQLNKETYVLAAQCTDQQLMNFIRRPAVT